MGIEENALVTLARQKAYLKETGATHDTEIETLINGVSSFFDLWCERTRLRERHYTNLLLDGNGENRLYLPDFPINHVDAVEEDDVELTEDTDFFVYSRHNQGYLTRNGDKWLAGHKNIDITYGGGFHIIETFHYDSGGTTIPAIGDTLIGNTSGAEGEIILLTLDTGTWAGGDAAGNVQFSSVEEGDDGYFEDNETIKIGGNGAADVMTVNEPYEIIRVPKDLELACMQQVAMEFQRQQQKSWGEVSRSFGDGSVTTMTEEELLPYVKMVLNRYRRQTV